MSSAAEMFVDEQVEEAIRKKYPELAEASVETPSWAYDVWDARDLPEKFVVEVINDYGDVLTNVEVTVDFDIDGDDSGRYIAAHVAHVKEVKKVGKAT